MPKTNPNRVHRRVDPAHRLARLRQFSRDWRQVIADLLANGMRKADIARAIGAARPAPLLYQRGVEPIHSTGEALLALHRKVCNVDINKFQQYKVIEAGKFCGIVPRDGLVKGANNLIVADIETCCAYLGRYTAGRAQNMTPADAHKAALQGARIINDPKQDAGAVKTQ